MTEFQSAASTPISLENERLRAELETRLEELRSWRESAIGAAEAMRRRMERNLHDGIERGLAHAVEELCPGAEVSSHLRTCLQHPPPDRVAAAAYFAVSEALTNVAKHAHASTVHVFVGSDDQQLIVEIHDDGIGGASTASGSGLRGLTDRVEALGGRLTISSPSGSGTNIRAEIPFAPLDPGSDAAL